MLIGGNRVLQSDFPSYLSHSALLINTIAIITSSGRFSIHYTSFISVAHTLHLNYYHMQSQYKSVIQFVQHQRKLHSDKTILGTSIGAGCSNQIQVAQGQDLHYGGALVQVAFGCCIPLLYLYPRWSCHCATCAGGVFPSTN